ncbi:MAG TPA: heterodisulfide reductase, subunit B [Firmicutes bacterium]|nr:heterodisulfide reductase, subunit B [Bacillota bacterium]
MEVSYFPGCTLKQTARNFEISAISSCKLLGIDLKELTRWNCCGTVYSLSTDDSMHHLAPIRDLIRVREDGFSEVVTLCSMCYNTLKQANGLMRQDPDRLHKMNDFMYREEDYIPDVEVYHLVTYIKEHLGFDKVREFVKKPLTGLKVAVYYGCLLLRPDSVKLDDRENPRIMEDLLETLGSEVVDYPYLNECCGSYHTLGEKDLVLNRTNRLITEARRDGADLLVLSCPECDFNLDYRQKETQEKYPNFQTMPVLYFTQLMNIALGGDLKDCGFELNYIDPLPVLRESGIIK